MDQHIFQSYKLDFDIDNFVTPDYVFILNPLIYDYKITHIIFNGLGYYQITTDELMWNIRGFYYDYLDGCLDTTVFKIYENKDGILFMDVM